MSATNRKPLGLPGGPGSLLNAATTLHVRCHQCGELHVAEYSHEGRFNEGAIYAVVCTTDHLTDYYTTEALEQQASKYRQRIEELSTTTTEERA